MAAATHAARALGQRREQSMGVGSPQAGLSTKHAGPKASLPLMHAKFVHAAPADHRAAAVAADAAADEQAAAVTDVAADAAAAICTDAGFDLAAAVDTHIRTVLVLQLHLVDST